MKRGDWEVRLVEGVTHMFSDVVVNDLEDGSLYVVYEVTDHDWARRASYTPGAWLWARLVEGSEYINPVAPLESELKPCPCCGCEARVKERQAATWFQVRCMELPTCGIAGRWHSSLEKARALWNRRPDK